MIEMVKIMWNEVRREGWLVHQPRWFVGRAAPIDLQPSTTWWGHVHGRAHADVGELDGAGLHGVISCLDVTTIYNAARGGMKSRRCRCLTIPNHKFERAWRVRVGRSLDGRCNLLGVSKERGRLRHYALDETQVTSIGPVRSGEAVRTGSREREISRKKPSMWHAS